MSDWNKAKKLIKKAFDCGYVRLNYGELVACNSANLPTPYPFTDEETKFIYNYFKGKQNDVVIHDMVHKKTNPTPLESLRILRECFGKCEFNHHSIEYYLQPIETELKKSDSIEFIAVDNVEPIPTYDTSKPLKENKLKRALEIIKENYGKYILKKAYKNLYAGDYCLLKEVLK